MLERLVEYVLASKLRSILLNFDRDSFSLWLWQGRVVLRNLLINPLICEVLDLPLELTYGKVEKVDLMIPWRALSTEPVEVRIEGVAVVLRSTRKDQWTINRDKILKTLRDKVDFEDGRLRIKDAKSTDTSYSRLTERVIRNLQVEVRNVHIRLESEDCHCCLGLVSELIACGPPAVVSDSEGFTKELTVGVVYFYTQTKDFSPLHSDQISEEKALDDLTCRFLCGEESDSVICPFSLQAELGRLGDKFTLKVSIPTLDLHLTQAQYQGISRVMKLICEFNEFQVEGKEEIRNDFRRYLEERMEETPLKVRFKAIRSGMKAGKSGLNADSQTLYDAIISTTSEEELGSWLLELNGERAQQPSRFASITSWFTGNRALDPEPPPSPDYSDISLLELEVNLAHFQVTLQGLRTTCSEYIYRLDIEGKDLGWLYVQQAKHRRFAVHLCGLEVRFQDPVSLNRLPLVQFSGEKKGQEQVFLTVNQSIGVRVSTTIALEIAGGRLLISMNIVNQLQSFFSLPPDSPSSLPPSSPSPSFTHLQHLWEETSLDLQLHPWDLVLLTDETRPSPHLILSLGLLTVTKLSNFVREDTSLIITQETIEITLATCNLVLVALSQIPVSLFALSKPSRVSGKVDTDSFDRFYVSFSLPETEIHLSKPSIDRLKSLFSLYFPSNPTLSPYIETHKKQLLSKFSSHKHTGLVYRHFHLTWQTYFCILTNGYLYFFQHPEDLEAKMYFLVEECEIRDPVSERLVGEMEELQPFEEIPPYQILLIAKNRERSCRLGFESLEKYKKWTFELSKSHNLHSFPPQIASKALSYPSISLEFVLPNFEFTFEIGESPPFRPISLTLNTAEIQVSMKKEEINMSFTGKVGLMGGNKALLREFREILAPISPLTLKIDYKTSEDQELKVNFETEKLELYWNHDTISCLITEFSPKKQPNLPSNSPSIPIFLTFSVKSLIFTLNNEPVQFTFSEIHLQNLNFHLNPSEIALNLSSILILDVSNYPDSVQIASNPQIRRIPIIKSSRKAVISLFLQGNNVEMSVFGLEIVYIQQPFLRILNCLLHNVLPIVM